MSNRLDYFDIPELCNTSALALLILASQLSVVIMHCAGGEMTWVRFGLTSLFVQWVALVSAGLLCLLRKVLARMSLVVGSPAAFFTIILVTLLVSIIAEMIVDRGPGVSYVC